MEKRPERVTIAAIQMASIPYRVEENLEKADRMVREAASRGARIIVLPELFNTGPSRCPRRSDMPSMGRCG